jgi:hypothetical protein
MTQLTRQAQLIRWRACYARRNPDGKTQLLDVRAVQRQS